MATETRTEEIKNESQEDEISLEEGQIILEVVDDLLGYVKSPVKCYFIWLNELLLDQSPTAMAKNSLTAAWKSKFRKLSITRLK